MNTQHSDAALKLQFLLSSYHVTAGSCQELSLEEQTQLAETLADRSLDWIFVGGIAAARYIPDEERHRVVLFEESLEAVHAMQIYAVAFDVQIKLPHVDRSQFISQLASDYPTDSCEVLLFGSMKTFEEYHVALKKSASFQFFSLQEDLSYHRLVDNIIYNMPKLAVAAKGNVWPLPFSGKEVIVCGAGPSLETHLETIRNAAKTHPIVAGGSAIPILVRAGIKPTLAVAIDPNQEETERLAVAFSSKVPLVCSGRIHKGVLNGWQGPLIYLPTSTGGYFEQMCLEAMGLKTSETDAHLFASTTVASLCFDTARRFGASSLLLCGFDLAFSEGKEYAMNTYAPKKMERGKTHLTRVKEGVAETTVHWAMERDALVSYLSAWPDLRCKSLFHEGLRMPSVSDVTAPSVQTYDDTLPQCLQQMKSDARKKIQQVYAELYESLLRVDRLLDEMKCESRQVRIDVFEMDCAEEVAYRVLLAGTKNAAEFVAQLHSKKDLIDDKWQYISQLCKKYIEMFKISFVW